MRYLLLFFFTIAIQASAQQLTEEKVRRTIPAFEAYLESARKGWQVPNVAAAIIYKDKLYWWKGFGDQPTPNPDTVFPIGSTTKAFTATLLAMMVDDGKLDWDSKVIHHLPEFALKDPWVTKELQVDDLLAQHLGFPTQALTTLAGLGYSSEQIVKAMKWVEPVTSFRSRYAYTNSPHLVAGQLIAKTSGKGSWTEALQERILKPLRMTSTTWTQEALDNTPNRAQGHINWGGDVRPVSNGHYPYNLGAAGGLNSNLRDLSKWVRFQLKDGGNLVSKNSLKYTRRPQTVISQYYFYCMGWLELNLGGHIVTFHNGGSPGHTSFIGIQPEEQLGVIVLGNLGGADLPGAVGLKFFHLVHGQEGPDYSAIYLKNRRVSQVKPATELNPIEELPGTYHHPALGEFRIQSNRLCQFNETGVNALLEPIGPHNFRIRITDGWLKEIGWEFVGELLFTPETKNIILFLGEGDQGSSFTLTKKSER